MLRSDAIEKFISVNKKSEKVLERITIFETVRDFLYQINGVNDLKKLLEIKEGYCASKHRLLQAVYGRLGYETKLCFIPFSFDMVYLPDFLKDWGYANKKGYHVFLKINIDGKWVDIDATFNSELKDFYVVNENRDGFSSQKIICEYDKLFIPNSLEEEGKIKEILSDANVMTSEDKEWVEKFNNWIKLFN